MKLPRHSEIWLGPYVKDRIRRAMSKRQPIKRIWLSITDHWEPFWRQADLSTARTRVQSWVEKWPRIAGQIKDSAGNAPKYSFFYPEEQYQAEFISSLAEMTRAGFGDVEVHIHHDGEGRENFIQRMSTFLRRLHEDHGLLRIVEGRTAFGFIHGNWALNNSRPDGRWCGINDEIAILKGLGCYADFTMPSGASPTQAKTVNEIYWSRVDVPEPKCYDSGTPATVGGGILPQLLMVPGPLGLRWRGRLVPRMETGELAAYDPPTPYRVRRWIELAPQLGGDIFIKLYSHGAPETNAEALLNADLSNMYRWVAERAAEIGAETRFVSAWEMYSAIAALCSVRDSNEKAATSNGTGADPDSTKESSIAREYLARTGR
jgi:hypothetical protein